MSKKQNCKQSFKEPKEEEAAQSGLVNGRTVDEKSLRADSEFAKETEKTMHYRRCHVCNAVSGGVDPVLECKKCEKVMAPFFYFDVQKGNTYTDDQLQDQLFLRKEERAPLEGLTVYW